MAYRVVLLCFLRVMRSGVADSSASRTTSGEGYGAGGRIDFFLASRFAPRGGFGSTNLVSASLDRPNPGCHLRYRAKGLATGCFSSLGNCHFRERNLLGCRRDDVG